MAKNKKWLWLIPIGLLLLFLIYENMKNKKYIYVMPSTGKLITPTYTIEVPLGGIAINSKVNAGGLSG